MHHPLDGKALDYRFYMQMRVEKKAFAYRVPIRDYNYLQCAPQPKSCYCVGIPRKSKCHSVDGILAGGLQIFFHVYLASLLLRSYKLSW